MGKEDYYVKVAF